MNPISKEEFKSILDCLQQSGLSTHDFCTNEMYTVSSFHYWKSKFGFSRPYKSCFREESFFPGIASVSLKSSQLGSASSTRHNDAGQDEITIKFPAGVEVSYTGQRQTDTALQV